MFQKKDIIFSETLGVCKVENIVSLSATKGNPGVPYYYLKSVFDDTKVAYIPVDNHQVMLRELFSIEEAKELSQKEESKKDENLWAAIQYVLREETHGTAE